MLYRICEHVNTACFRETNWKDLGPMGDYIGGIMNPIITFASFLILSCALLVQIGELSEATKSRKELARATSEQERTERRGQIVSRTTQLVARVPNKGSKEQFEEFCDTAGGRGLDFYYKCRADLDFLEQSLEEIKDKIKFLNPEELHISGVKRLNVNKNAQEKTKELLEKRNQTQAGIATIHRMIEGFEIVRSFMIEAGALGQAGEIDPDLLASLKPNFFSGVLTSLLEAGEGGYFGIPEAFYPTLHRMHGIATRLVG